MSFLSRKKKPEQSSLQPFKPKEKELEFPKIPSPQQDLPSLELEPAPEEALQEDIHTPLMPEYQPMTDFEPEEEFSVPQRKEKVEFRPHERFQPEERYESGIERAGEKPLFIKIERYQEAVETLEKIKEVIKDSENLLQEIAQIRQDEEKELQNWKNNIEQIKNKLLLVDKHLFESE